MFYREKLEFFERWNTIIESIVKSLCSFSQNPVKGRLNFSTKVEVIVSILAGLD